MIIPDDLKYIKGGTKKVVVAVVKRGERWHLQYYCEYNKMKRGSYSETEDNPVMVAVYYWNFNRWIDADDYDFRCGAGAEHVADEWLSEIMRGARGR